MAELAPNHLYRDEWESAFERGKSTLSKLTNDQYMTSSNGALTATWLTIAAPRGAVGRGAYGLIPASVDDKTQTTATLVEKHDNSHITDFNAFTGQANQRMAMATKSLEVINREIDDRIIAALATGTVDVNSSGEIMTKGIVTRAVATLGRANVPNDGQIYGLLTPAAWGAMTDLPGFTSSDYVPDRKLVEGIPDGPRMVDWMGVKWMMHNALPGVGTATAECYLWHKRSLGYAYANVAGVVGFNEEHAYHYVRNSVYHAAILLQNTGVVTIFHDDTVYNV